MSPSQQELLLTETNEGDVVAALSLLRESLETEQKRIFWEGSQAMARGDLATAEAVIDFAKRLLAFTGKVESLGSEWQELQNLRDEATPEVQQIVSKRFFGRIGKGEITPHQDFCRPILETLVELGGGARTKTVLDRIGVKMKSVLKPADYECHKSDAKQIRWRNTAQWARNTMANEDGRMKGDSRTGYWEISDKGRAWLKSADSASTSAASDARPVKDLDREQPHSLDEDMTFKRPCGLTIDGKRHSDVNTWSRAYELVLLHLAKKDPALFKTLPDNPAMTTKRGNRRFSRNPADLRKPLALPNGIHAECNLSANDLCASIRLLLGIFSLPQQTCTLFLRQDRKA